MTLTCDPKHPRASPYLKVICRNLRWIPFGFIVGLISYAYLTVVISLGVQFHLVQKGRWGVAISEILVSTILAGGALWSFIVAVFKDPGGPCSGRAGHPESYLGSHHSEYELDREGAAESESLMRSNQEDAEDEEHGARAPLLQAPIPGQPQYPARSEREQLNDLTRHRLPSFSSSSSPAAATQAIESRSNIWVKSSGESRWCNKCSAPKPDRCHHCSSCKRCVLRMDHHCPWLANRCIGLRNHKAFFLFLSYTALFCVYCCQECARSLLAYVDNEQNGFETSPISWAIVLFLGFIFGASLVPFAGYHAYLICNNRTTIESMEGSGRVRLKVASDPIRPAVEDRLRNIVGRASQENRRHAEDRPETGHGANQHQRMQRQEQSGRRWRPDEHLSRQERQALKKASKLNVYDVGAKRNWIQIMGRNWLSWFVPIGEPEGDGFSYMVRTDTLRKLEEITADIRIQDQQRRQQQTGSRGSTFDDGNRGRYSTDTQGDTADDDSIYGSRADSREATRFGYPEHPRRSARTSAPTSLSGTGGREGSDDAYSKLGAVGDDGLNRKKGQRFKGAHGVMEWGEAPKKSFVLYDVEDDDDDQRNQH